MVTQANPGTLNALRKLSQKKKRLFRAAKTSSSALKWEKYFTVLRDYTKLLRLSKKKFHHQDLLNILRTNPKKFWNVLTPPRGTVHNISLFNPDGSLVPVDQRSNAMNSYFSSIFTHEPAQTMPVLPRSNLVQMLPIHITAEGIVKLINNLKLSSSPGPDNIPAKVIKSTKIISSLILQIIFTQSLAESSLLDDWKLSRVVPVFRSGNRSDPSNYRPIS